MQPPLANVLLPPEAKHLARKYIGGIDPSRSNRTGCVSVVTPTIESRRMFHKQLWACFESQSWPDKELIVVETYQQRPSNFFIEKAKKDVRLTYVNFQTSINDDLSIGAKRNIGAYLASGEFIANFDDDDLYSPSYLNRMVEAMTAQAACAITLSAWYVMDTDNNGCEYCDPEQWNLLNKNPNPSDDDRVQKWTYGYGFSYVHRRQAVIDNPYDDRNMGEDYDFYMRVQGSQSKTAIALLKDTWGICVHMFHRSNTAPCMVAVFPVTELTFKGLDIWKLKSRSVDSSVQGRLTKIWDEAFRNAPQNALYGHFAAPTVYSPTTPNYFQNLEALEAWLSTSKNAQELNAKEAEPRHAVAEEPNVSSRGPADSANHEVAIHTSVGAIIIHCSLGASQADLISSLEDKVGPVSSGAKLLQEPPDDMFGTREVGQDGILQHMTELWLLEPQDGDVPPLTCWTSIQGGAQLPGQHGVQPTRAVHVVCKSGPATGSCRRVFHVDLPRGAHVSNLREVLGIGLPPTAHVLKIDQGHGSVALKDTDLVPDKVVLSSFVSVVEESWVLTRDQIIEAVELMNKELCQPHRQWQLEQMKQIRIENGNAEGLFRQSLTRWLFSEGFYAYLAMHFNLPENEKGAECIHECLKSVLTRAAAQGSDKQLLLPWHAMEVLMKNTVLIGISSRALAKAGASEGEMEEYMASIFATHASAGH